MKIGANSIKGEAKRSPFGETGGENFVLKIATWLRSPGHYVHASSWLAAHIRNYP